MALEYSTSLIPVTSLDEAIDQDGIILFGLNSNNEPALLSPVAFRGADYTGDINGPYDPLEMKKLVTYGQVQEFFGPEGRGQTDYKGAQGIQGPQGPIGTSTSLRGYQGIKGEDAEIVAQGVQGYQGYQGIQGVQVTTQGGKGYIGPIGPDHPLTWERFTELMTTLGITFGDEGELIANGVIAAQSVEAEYGFYQTDRESYEEEHSHDDEDQDEESEVEPNE